MVIYGVGSGLRVGVGFRMIVLLSCWFSLSVYFIVLGGDFN